MLQSAEHGAMAGWQLVCKITRPVHRRNHDLSASSTPQQSMHCIEPILCRNANETTCGVTVDDIVARGHASFRPGAPVDTKSRHIVCVTVPCQRIEKCICGSIVALTRRAEDAGDRREEHE